MLLCSLRNKVSRFQIIIRKSLKNEGKNSSFHHSSKKEGNISVVENSSIGFGSLIKPFGFAVSFTGCSFGCATIWQYEEMRKFTKHIYNGQLPFKLPGYDYKRSEVRRKVNSWWHAQTEGQKVALVIASINLLVFILWRVPAFQPMMTKYFTSAPALRGSCLPMLLSTFSHYSFLHLFVNMYVLYSFSSGAVNFYGKEQFTALYLSAGVFASFASYVYNVTSGRFLTSLGASGALMAILSSMCVQFPDTLLQIAFLPFFTFSAGHAIKALVAFDVIGLLAKWKLFDHAAHLGGAAAGICYLQYGRDYIWNNREPLLKWYHDIRERKEP